jgi:hypothetical protein
MAIAYAVSNVACVVVVSCAKLKSPKQCELPEKFMSTFGGA